VFFGGILMGSGCGTAAPQSIINAEFIVVLFYGLN
jgi:hypothetical protein